MKLLFGLTIVAAVAAYYPSFQELSPALGQYFPNLPAVPYSADFGDPLSVTQERLAERSGEASAYAATLLNHVTINELTLPALLWMVDPATGAALPKEQHVSMETPEQLFAMMMPPALYAESQDEVAAGALIFTDSEMAEHTFWRDVQNLPAFNIASIITAADEHEGMLREVLGDAVVDALPKVHGSGGFFFVDTREMSAVPPHSDDLANTRYAVGTFVLLAQYRSGHHLTPVAVSVSINLGGEEGVQTRVFSKAGSEGSRWRMALLAARTSATQWGVATHIYTYHIVPGAFQRSLFNTLHEAHPLRDALLPFSKFNMQFVTLVMANALKLTAFPFTNDQPDLAGFFPLFANYQQRAVREGFQDLLPSAYLANHGVARLARDDDLVSTARLQSDVEKATQKFARRMTAALYVSDDEVTGDADLQAFVADLRASGLHDLALTGRVATKHDLAELLSVYLYLVVVHGTARISSLLSPVDYALAPTSFMSPAVVTAPEESPFSVADMLAAMPDSHVISKALAFFSFFQTTLPYEPLVPAAGLDAELPYASAVMNSHLIRLRRDMERVMSRADVQEDEVSHWPINVESR